MTGHAIGIDHIGVVGPTLEELARAFAAVGFHVTPRATHEGARTGNHCVMLDGSYLELVSTTPGGTSATLARFLARYAGAHILALRTGEPDEAAARLARAGFPGLSPSASVRALNDHEGPEVGFTLVTPPDPPEGRIHLIRHRDPDVMWQPRFLVHPNGATRLAEVMIACDDPARSAAWFSVVAGLPVSPDPMGGYTLETVGQRLRLVPADAAQALLPMAIPALPWIGVLTLHTADGNAALRRLVACQGIEHEVNDGAIALTCAGVVLRFLPTPL